MGGVPSKQTKALRAENARLVEENAALRAALARASQAPAAAADAPPAAPGPKGAALRAWPPRCPPAV
jgi:hypothetical protein